MQIQTQNFVDVSSRPDWVNLSLMACVSGLFCLGVSAAGLEPGCLESVAQCGGAAHMLAGHDSILVTQFSDSSGIQICEIVDPNVLLPRGIIPGSPLEAPWGFDLHDDLIIVASQNLLLYSTADLDQPQLLAVVPLVFSARSVALTESLALVSTSLGTVDFYDITQPANPLPLGMVQHPNSNPFVQILVHGNLAYVAGIDVFGEVSVIDFTNPVAPALIASVPGLAPRAIDIQDDLLAVGGKFDLTLLDISNPSSPQTLIDWPLPAQANAVQIIGSSLFVATGSEMIQFDISNLMQPDLVGAVIAQPGLGLFERQDRLYASDLLNGCVAYAIDACGAGSLPGDCDASGMVDWPDFAGFEPCMLGPGMTGQAGCDCFDLDADSGQTVRDAGLIQQFFGR